MIQRFRFGLPLPTDSVVQEIPVSAGPVPFLTAEEDGWAYRMAPDAIVYGLGEMPRGITPGNRTASLMPWTRRISCMAWVKTSAASTSAAGTT